MSLSAEDEKAALATTEARRAVEAMDYGSISTTKSVSEETEELIDDESDVYAEYGELADLLEGGTESWTEEEDRRVRFKADWRIMTWACVMFLSLQLNRINIVNVLTTDFLMDLGMQQNDYNLGQTIYFFSFLVMEIPTQIMNTIVGPTIWIPTMMTTWALVGFLQTFITNKASYLATRAILGACQGGFVPGIALYVTSFYKAHEVATRLAMLWSTQYITNSISALLASGIFNMDGLNGWHNWQWLFFLEGLLSLSIGISTFFMMPSFRKPVISKVFTARETAILRARVILDDPSKSKALDGSRVSMMKSLGPRDIITTLTDIYLIPLFLLAWLGFLPSVASYQFMTIMFRSYGYATFEANLLVIPANMTIMTGMLVASFVSDKYRKRWPIPIAAMTWVLPFLILQRVLPDDTPYGLRVFCVIFTVGFPYYTPVLMSWLSANVGDQSKRALAIAIYNIGVQCGSISASNVYRAGDAPFYRNGNSLLIGVSVLVVLITLSTRWLFKRENLRRDMMWSMMTSEEREDYSATTTDKGNRRLDFRFQL
ncbi:major facilitator superfamily domain-containing protein [Myxozyma melibiosi]|uniref:Major facilitator superfamily domain-containing protein n=1 Tax=Myxozyma melibiosi TaxID=54550 RepID=A0ABR1FFL4_9ASCO